MSSNVLYFIFRFNTGITNQIPGRIAGAFFSLPLFPSLSVMRRSTNFKVDLMHQESHHSVMSPVMAYLNKSSTQPCPGKIWPKKNLQKKIVK